MEELRLLGRILLAGYMLVGAWNNSTGFNPTVEQMTKLRLPQPALLLRAVIVFEIVAAVALFIPRVANFSALMLAVFCIVAPTLFHPFWTMPPSFEQFLHKNLFFANIAVAGGMFALLWV